MSEFTSLVVQGNPKVFRVDDCLELVSKFMDEWAYEIGGLCFRPGKPAGNTFMESFHGCFRGECMNVNWLLSLKDIRIRSIL